MPPTRKTEKFCCRSVPASASSRPARQEAEDDDCESCARVRDPSRHSDGLADRHEPDHEHRDAEDELDGLRRVHALEGEQRPERHRNEAADPTTLQPLAGGRLGQVADRGHDVQPADSPGRNDYDDEGQQHADGVRDDHALQLDVVLDRDAFGAECAAEHEDHAERHRDADGCADGGGEQVVGEALVDVHLDQVSAACADRPGDPELSPALRCEHHEDQEDQQESGEDREASERREERHEGVALLVGRLERVPLGRVDLEPEPLQRRLEQRRDLVRVADAARRSADVRDQHVLDLAGMAEQPLGRRQSDEQRAPRRCRFRRTGRSRERVRRASGCLRARGSCDRSLRPGRRRHRR